MIHIDGIEDIKNRIIRATSIKFKEDPLRVYRVARFASELNFEVEEDTISLMKDLKKELSTLSAERVFCEFRKALATEKPSIFFNILRQAEVIDIHFKEINDLIGSEQPIKYHPEGDSYNHTMLAVDNSAKLTKDLVIRYCTLVHDLGKGTTPKEIYPHHYGHEERGVPLVKNLSNRIKVPTIWKKAGITACKEHMRGGIFMKMTPEKKVSFIERVSKSPLGIEGLQIVVYCDRNRIGIIDSEEEKQCTFVNIGKKILTEINGKYVKERYNVKEGIELGKKIHEERVKIMREYKS